MTSGAPGFFGKVSSHGDFVSRRLPTSFTQGWDNWLQQGMHAARLKLGVDWLPSYLTSPLWRFALSPGLLDQQGWAGVLMPSVDRVGRHFPLTLAAPVDAAAPQLDWLAQHAAWFDDLETLALSTLAKNFVLDEFDAALQTRSSLPGVAARAPDSAWCFPVDDPMAGIGSAGGAIAQVLLAGHSLWWTDGSPHVGACVLVCRGLPDAAHTVAMQDGSWAPSGWQLPALLP